MGKQKSKDVIIMHGNIGHPSYVQQMLMADERMREEIDNIMKEVEINENKRISFSGEIIHEINNLKGCCKDGK